MIVWKSIVGYEGLFSVSNDGQIRNDKTDRVLRQNLVGRGYPAAITKIGGRNGVNKVFRTHRELALAFIDNKNNYPCVNHIDGDKTNNKIDNLEWCTHKQNSQHAVDMGLIKYGRGPDNKNFSLNKEQVAYIKDNYVPYCRVNGSRALARKFNVGKRAVITAYNL